MPTNEEDIEERALRFRRMIGIDDSQVLIHAPTLLYKVQHYFPDITFSLVGDAELPPPGGQWNAEKKQFTFRQSVFEAANAQNPDPRARWTIAHEVSHFANGHTGIRHRSPKGSLEKTLLANVRSIEWLTDRFTAALLAPLHLVEYKESASSIATRFGFSEQAAQIRGDEAARAYRRRHSLTRQLPESIRSILDELKGE